MNTNLEEILKQYGLQPMKKRLIVNKFDRVLWKVYTDEGVFALKVLNDHNWAKRVSTLQNYLNVNGVPVVKVIPTLTGELLGGSDNSPSILFPWIDGHRLRYNKYRGLTKVVEGLAEFQLKSKGFEERVDCKLDFHNLSKEYISRYDMLMELHEYMIKNKEKPFPKLFLENYSFLKKRAEWVIENINKVGFEDVLRQYEREPILVHADYNRNNLIMNKEHEVRIIDLDNIMKGMPITDLSRLINWVNMDFRNWSSKRFEKIIKIYSNKYKLSDNEMDILLVDQVSPYLAISYALSYKKRKIGKRFLYRRFANCMRIDKNKIKSLNISL